MNIINIRNKILNTLDNLFNHGIVTNFTGLVLVMFFPAFITSVESELTGDLLLIGLGISLLYTGIIFFIIKDKIDYIYFGLGTLIGVYSPYASAVNLPNVLTTQINDLLSNLITILLTLQLIYTISLLKKDEWREEE